MGIKLSPSGQQMGSICDNLNGYSFKTFQLFSRTNMRINNNSYQINIDSNQPPQQTSNNSNANNAAATIAPSPLKSSPDGRAARRQAENSIGLGLQLKGLDKLEKSLTSLADILKDI